MASSQSALSPEPSPSRREEICKTRTDGSSHFSGTPESETPSSSMKEGDTPLSERTAPPTIEELEAMDREKGWKQVELESATPSGSSMSENSKRSSKLGFARTFSRQVSRISGTGRPATALQHLPKATVLKGLPEPTPLVSAAIPARRDRTEERVRMENRPRPPLNLERRSNSNVEHDDNQFGNTPPCAWGSGPVSAPSRLVNGCSEQLAGQQAPAIVRHINTDTILTAKANAKDHLDQQPPDLSPQQTQLEPYSTQSASPRRGDKMKRLERPQQLNVPSDGDGNNRAEKRSELLDVSLKSPSRRNAEADSDSDMDVEAQMIEKSPNSGDSSCGSPACWGGGLPPMRNSIAQGPQAARAAAALAPPSAVRYPEARHPRCPSSDKDSFAHTLKDDELDELWQGLGEGVSQRGGGSEVAFERPSPSGTAVSGAFPKLTANMLERHDQLAGDGKRRAANVMPIPKDVVDKTLKGLENGGVSSSKKSRGSSIHGQKSLLGLILIYGVLVLWMAHLVFNVLLLRDVILEDNQYLWALCFASGLLGTLLSLISCCQNGYKCKPAVDEDEGEEAEGEEGQQNGPHVCALPVYFVLLLAVVVALGMHASAMLFCKNDMELFLKESTMEPLCGDSDSFLLLPVVLDAVLLIVASLKASSLCWAWVLS